MSISRKEFLKLTGVGLGGAAAMGVQGIATASGGEVDSNGGSYYSFRTTKVGAGIPYIIYGLVYPREGVIVIVQVKSSGGALSCPLATLNDSAGVWFLNLGNLKDPASNDVFSYFCRLFFLL